jgi:hypothetical protein
MLFTPVAPRIKSKGIPIGGPLLSKTVCFFTRIAPHTKKQGAPDRWPLIQQKKLMLFTCVAPRTKNKGLLIGGPHLLLLSARASPRTKSKGLHRYVLQIYYFINQVSKSFCSSAGVIIPLYHSNNKPLDPDRWFNILLVYSCYQYTSKGHLLIFIFIKFIQHAKEKDYKALGLSLSSDSARLVKSYEDTKS